ncbi:DgyrCDS13394 [Dimorphilus gyrociliatus]|uniref:DgyrCDS13394 n=1 Tax=Dimorphilus gyrociliatus TaxID=2664684 RepID=A0A7I8WAH9_9ANNE|nr:DgyrCDS13394 [Dimorphilus gyrociliatus]
MQIKPVAINRNILERYAALDKECTKLEARNVLKSYQEKNSEYQRKQEEIKALRAEYDKSIRNTRYNCEYLYDRAKEKADVEKMQNPSVRSFFQNQDHFENQLSKEEGEYLEALNKQEIARKDLNNANKQQEIIEEELSEIKVEAERLQLIYTEMDELLAGIFNGKYGSDREYELETQVDLAMEQKQRISIALYKWKNARELLKHAVPQLGHAVSRWQQLYNLPHNVKFNMVTEVRNHVIAANQNITNARNYLQTIKFPYCTEKEMSELTGVANNVYYDAYNPQRHLAALQCYSNTHNKAAALLQWFNHVIDNIICKDLTRQTEYFNDRQRALRKERIFLIKLKVKEVAGEDVDDDFDFDDDDFIDEDKKEINAHSAEADNVSVVDLPGGTIDADNLAPSVDDKSNDPKEMSTKDLAPAPNMELLFGDVERLKEQHEREMKELQQAQDINKARMQSGLEEKLRARRSRRTRQEQHESQAEALK